jgi:hypothetical protein
MVNRIEGVDAMQTCVKGSLEGYHRLESEVDGKEFGSFKVFAETVLDDDGERVEGWFWAAGLPNRPYDGEPVGPFRTASGAFNDATWLLIDAREGDTA